MILNENGEHVVQHHVKYKEIHGVDEIIWMTISDHVKLHNRLRKEDKCDIPVEKLRKISMKARNRNPECKKDTKKYYQKYYLQNKEKIKDRSKRQYQQSKERTNGGKT